MPNCASRKSLLAAVMCLALAPAMTSAQQPLHETLLPDTTQGFLSVENVQQFEASWNRTQLGQLLQDPIMEPFATDLKNQLQGRWAKAFSRLGLTWDDLRTVPTGQTSMALIQPAPQTAAFALLADVTGNQPAVDDLLRRVDQGLTQQRATKAQANVQGVPVTTYNIPPAADAPQQGPRQAIIFQAGNLLVVTDNAGVAEGVLRRIAGQAQDNLARVPGFQAVMARAAAAPGPAAPEARWYVNPFGFITTMRIANPQPQQGKDMLRILASQGFDAVQGVGGFLNLSVDGRYDLLHRTLVYAPPVPGAAAGERYQLAARMLKFPNAPTLEPQPWVPRELATYVSLNMDIQQAFEHSGTLVDAVVGEEGVFEDVIESIEKDPNGPQINLRRDLIAHLGSRVTIISDYTLPITPRSERVVFAVETTEPAALAQTIKRTMETDPDARRHEINGIEIWEIVESQEELPQLPELQFDGFDPIGNQGAAPQQDAQKRRLPNAAVAVTNGNLYVATHMDYLTQVLAPAQPRESLAQAADYRLVMSALEQLLPEQKSFLIFSRTDEEYRPTYELIRAGRMPESQSLLGKLLNALAAEEEEGQLRAQQIQGAKLPEFDRVRRYFGPTGTVVISEDNGWFLTGVTMNKEAP